MKNEFTEMGGYYILSEMDVYADPHSCELYDLYEYKETGHWIFNELTENENDELIALIETFNVVGFDEDIPEGEYLKRHTGTKDEYEYDEDDDAEDKDDEEQTEPFIDNTDTSSEFKGFPIDDSQLN